MKLSAKTENLMSQLNENSKLGEIKKLAAEIKKDHDLALELWSTGKHFARLISVLIMDKKHIVDRARKVEEGLHLARATDPDAVRDMLRVAARRTHYINVSVTLGTIAALLVSLVVALLFASTFVPLNLAASVAILFVLAMTALVGALVAFLVEVRIAIAALRIGTP